MESPQYKVTYAVLLWCAACMARAVSAYSSQLHEPVEPHTVSYSTKERLRGPPGRRGAYAGESW